MGWNDLIGRRIGPYEIIEELGRGGTARVYRAYQESPPRYVAIKVLLNDAEDRLGFVRRFERELEAVAQLNHPNIVAVYESGELEDLVYLVMQVVNGGTFRQRLGQPLPVTEACSAVIQVARALQHAHARGIVHRDVKPSNMLIDTDNDNRILLTDFGIAKLAGMRGLTKSGTTIGTPEYMAPEQAEGREIDARADVYSLGCVLYEALAGRAPFVGASPVSVLYQQVHIKPDYIRVHNAEIPRELARIVDIALAKQPEQRFSSADSLAWALHPFTIARDRPTSSGPASGWTPLLDGSAAGLDLRTAPLSSAQGRATASPDLPATANLSGAAGREDGAHSGLGAEGLDALFPDDLDAHPTRGGNVRGSSTHGFPGVPDGYLPGSSLVTQTPGSSVAIGHDLLGSSGPRPTIPLDALSFPVRASETQSLGLPLTSDGELDMHALMSQVEQMPPEDLESQVWTPPADLPPYETWSSSEEVSPYTAWEVPPPASPFPMWDDRAGYPLYEPYEPELAEVPSIWGDVHKPAPVEQNDALTPPPIWRPDEVEPRAVKLRVRDPRHPARGMVVGVVALAVLVLALVSWAVVSALGLGVMREPSRTPSVADGLTATAMPTATATPAATATLTPQQLLDRQAAADFRGVVVANSQVNACAGGTNASSLGQSEAIWVSACLSTAAPPGPMSVVVEQGQNTAAVIARTTVYPGHSYAWAYYASNLARGNYHVVVTFNSGTAADIPLTIQ